jgi:hypothetical protein
MSRILLITHHITLCISCIAFLLVFYTCAFYVRPCGAKIKNSNGADPKECGGPQASSGKDSNIALNQGKHRCI